MNIKSLLLGSAAALVAVSGARAADAIVAAEPEPVEYVRVCDAFGTGYFYIPGTETCLRIHGYVRYDMSGGELLEAHSDKVLNAANVATEGTWNKRARASFRVSTASETEMGTLRTYVETRWQFDTNTASNAAQNLANTLRGYSNDGEFSINFAWIELGGLRIGKDESFFTTWTGYGGSVINDTLAGGYGPFDTNLISYTYNGGAFRAGLSLEEGDDSFINITTGARTGWGIDDYMPHVVAGVGYNAGMVDLSAVFAYDTRDNATFGAVTTIRGGWAGKVRADVTINDMASVFAMVMYGENASAYTTWASGAVTTETWSVIGGGSYQATDKVKLNVQGQWTESNVVGTSDRWSLVGNMNYTLVPGLVITPEVAYYDNGTPTGGAFGGTLRFQRSF
jgi:hypothetical protein